MIDFFKRRKPKNDEGLCMRGGWGESYTETGRGTRAAVKHTGVNSFSLCSYPCLGLYSSGNDLRNSSANKGTPMASIPLFSCFDVSKD